MLGMFLGVFAAAMHVAGYLIYVREVAARRIIPNAASYLMFAYGTALVAFLTIANNATAPQLLLPIFCAAASVIIAWLAFRQRGAEPVDSFEWRIFAVDVALTIGYLAANLGEQVLRVIAPALLLAGSLTSLTSFLPILRSTYRTPYREQPLPWILWTFAYALLTLTVIVESGFTNPVLLVYPAINLALHVAVVGFTLRRSKTGILTFNDGLRVLFHDRSAINGVGLYTQNRIARGECIWTMTGTLHFASEAHDNPDFVGLGPDVWIDPAKPINRLNHSCAPNAAFARRRQLIALRPIAPGEEITLDYSTTEADPAWSMNCSCGATACRREVRAIQIAFSSAVEAPAASPLMQLIWSKRRHVEARTLLPQPEIVLAPRGRRLTDFAWRRRGADRRHAVGVTAPVSSALAKSAPPLP